MARNPFVPPHRIRSRPVTKDDIERVILESNYMKMLVSEYGECVALAHPQIDNKDPLRFYVEKWMGLVINPKIVLKSAWSIEGKEGCMTFPGRKHLPKKRAANIEISYQTIEGKDFVLHTQELKGIYSIIAQHEIDHLNGIYCYDV